MSNPKLLTATRRLLSQTHRLAKKMTRGLVLWLLRGLLLIGRQPQSARGFVLPTTVLLLLLLTLTVGAITLRTYSRTNQAIGERQQRVIYNAGTPAIDRAKAKLEYMFDRQRDPRFPSGVPGEGVLYGMLINDGQPHGAVGNQLTISQHFIINEDGNSTDPYTFPDEEDAAAGVANTIDVDGNGQPDRLDLDEDGNPDNAWIFRADTDSDGITDATVAYSIIFQTPPNPEDMERASDAAVAARADLLQVRHGPLSNSNGLNQACSFGDGDDAGVGIVEGGWFEDPSNSSMLRKNFQVDVYVLPDDMNGTVSTLEFHQDRQMERGNKWGAWFRNDLEVFPGPRFNWNGAMHTEGNLIVGNSNFRGLLISSPASCLYSRDSSEITIADVQADPEEGLPAFQGQFISGKTGDNSFSANENYFHIYGDRAVTEGNNYGGNQYVNTNRDATEFQRSNDSVPNSGRRVIDYTLDPVTLMTQDVSKARGIDEPDTPENYRETAWADRDLVKEGRLYNKSEETPYVDDSFRADDRYGPKPRIRGKRIPGNIGEPIVNDRLDTGSNPLLDDEMLRLEPPEGDDQGVNLGLDGYWDRRARNHGLRITVGERLELGNTYGWGDGIDGVSGAYRKAIDEEPLLPWSQCTGNNNNRCHEARQRRALYDNLAAVQAAVFYHASTAGLPSDDSAKDFPTACMASTVHPGSAESLILSGAFKDLRTDISNFLRSSTIYSATSTHPVVSNFFMGTGTNGWEYEPVPETVTNEASFANALAATQPLGKALRNLAYFAGDPRGGTPSFEPVDNTSDDMVHPYPWMSMWGDFSLLRRVLAQLDGLSYNQGNPFGNASSPDSAGSGVAYLELSPADKSTLHVASCMIGMLAYNIGFLDSFNYSQDSAALQALNDRLTQLMSGPRPGGVRQVGVNEPPEAFIAGLKQWRNVRAGDVPASMISLAETIMLKEQVSRDRRYGFFEGYSSNVNNDAGATYDLGGTYPNLEKLATNWPKFPMLHYVFPNDFRSTTNFPDGIIDDNDVFEEAEFGRRDHGGVPIRDRNIERVLNTIDGSPAEYQAIDLSDESTLRAIAVYPKPLNRWVLPHEDAGVGNTNLSNRANGVMIGCLDNLCGAAPGASALRLVRVGFKDTSLLNGRELLPVRAMDVNLDLIRQDGTGLAGDRWLPNTGIVYAFREDAVREDAITRPTAIAGNADAAWNTCGRDAVFSDPSEEPDCYMNAGNIDAFNSTDPPLNSNNRISAKPVDYYPDPDRRPHGFRLRNGMRLDRSTDTEGRGLSFVTDDPVYIMGDFNLHQTTTCAGNDNCRLEEFTQTLNDTYTNFYSRNSLDARFARPATDLWRPSEILADAITILSDRFCDGSVEDITRTVAEGSNSQLNGAFVTDLYGCQNNGNRTSYLNMNRLRDNIGTVTLITGQRERWQHADPYDSLFAGNTPVARLKNNTPITPVIFSRNGNPIMVDGYDDYDRRYYVLTDGKPLIATGTNRVNAIIISGLIPSRANQAYGGLHNFPRFIESWSNRNLYISGSLLQLSFSKYATAPFSQNSWESGSPTTGGESIDYYNPPNRRWGYDVGLQYAPAGPIAQRFVTSGSNPRSEFYSEPPADDPYMLNLCRQIADNPDVQCAN